MKLHGHTGQFLIMILTQHVASDNCEKSYSQITCYTVFPV